MKNTTLFVLIFAVYFGYAQRNRVAVPTIVFKVCLGETVVKDGVSITFSKVLEDSRCPSDVSCIWAGLSTVEVRSTFKGMKRIEVVSLERGKQPIIAISETAVFSAVKLSPYPTSATIGKMEYVLLVCEAAIVDQN